MAAASLDRLTFHTWPQAVRHVISSDRPTVSAARAACARPPMHGRLLPAWRDRYRRTGRRPGAGRCRLCPCTCPFPANDGAVRRGVDGLRSDVGDTAGGFMRRSARRLEETLRGSCDIRRRDRNAMPLEQPVDVHVWCSPLRLFPTDAPRRRTFRRAQRAAMSAWRRPDRGALGPEASGPGFAARTCGGASGPSSTLPPRDLSCLPCRR